MRIDNLHRKIIVKNHPIYKGKRFCLVNYDGFSTVGNPYESYINWKNPVSVLWTQNELEGFRPNDTVHNFLLSCRKERQEEIERLSKKIKGARVKWRDKNNYKDTYNNNVYINPKQMLKDKVEFLKGNNIIFVEIDFV